MKNTAAAQHERELKNMLGLYGLVGVVAIISEWADREGGLRFVQIVVRDFDQSMISDALRKMEQE